LGYSICITRVGDDPDLEYEPIELEEWLNYLSTDREMRAEEAAQLTTPKGERISMRGAGMARWTGHPSADSSQGVWFCHGGNGICVNHPDAQTTAKMHIIAQAFGARVLGEEHEEYGPDGEIVPGTEPERLEASPRAPVPGFFRRLFGRRR